MSAVIDSTNLQPPFLGQQLPLYPQVNQILRVYAPAIIGANVYPGYVQQWNPPLILRDREAGYVFEPNRIVLGPGYYDCRLVGVFGNLPLYVTHCCPGGDFGSSSSSGGSASSGVPGVAACGCPNVPLTLTATFSAGTGTCAALNGLTLPLAYNPGDNLWSGIGKLGGILLSILFFCYDDPYWKIVLDGPTGSVEDVAVASCNASGAFLWRNPVAITLNTTGICLGTAIITITS